MKSCKYRPGFTLIEMLLALSLTAMLLTIVSVTIGAVSRDNERLKAMDSGPYQLGSVIDVLRRDLRQAQAYRMHDGVLTLHGRADIKMNIPGEIHDPVQIEYEVLDLNNTYWLVRRINTIEATTNQESVVELLCGGVSALSVVVSLAEDVTAIPDRKPVEASLPQTVDPTIMSPVPDQVTVSLTLTEPDGHQAALQNNDPTIRPRAYTSNSDRLNQQHLIVIR